MSIIIKPCKSCGSINLYIKEKSGTHMIYCKDCNTYQCNVPKKDLDFVKDTIDDWNTSVIVEQRLNNDDGVRLTTDDILERRNIEKIYKLHKSNGKANTEEERIIVKNFIHKLVELL